MGGSELKPVSNAAKYLVFSPKASSKLLKPDLEPKTANQGVQM